jgi:hypothetical protein
MDVPTDPRELDPFVPIEQDGCEGTFAELIRRPAVACAASASAEAGAGVAILHGFDLLDQPLLADVAALPGEVVVARSVVALRRDMIGAPVVFVCEGADARRPIILGVVRAAAVTSAAAGPALSVQADDERLVISAEREIVLRCGDASITMTRGGRVVIDGKFVLSRSSGYNKIKGAAVDIN